MSDKDILTNIISKLENDISSTEVIISNLRDIDSSIEDTKFYSGRLAYMRELQSHLAYLGVPRG